MSTHPMFVKAFYPETQISTSWWDKRKGQGIRKVGRIFPLALISAQIQQLYYSSDQSGGPKSRVTDTLETRSQ